MKGQVRNSKKRTILGITGSFGSGKTTVAKIFKSYGAKIIDADKLAHRCLNPPGLTYKRIIDIFGKKILKENRTIDRKKLARVVFSNKNLLNRLNDIIHPVVIKDIKYQIKNSRSRIVILDAPLLIEGGLRRIVDKLIVVKITRVEQIKRIQKRTFLSKADIHKRIACQVPLRVKARLADFVIDNSGAIQKTRKQVKKIWASLNLEAFPSLLQKINVTRCK